MTLRLLLLGGDPRWLPPLERGRLVIGSDPTAHARFADLPPVSCVVERPGSDERRFLIRDASGSGSVHGPAGAVPAGGSLVRGGDRFKVGAYVIAVVDDPLFVPAPPELQESACVLCRAASGSKGRSILDVRVCAGCLGAPQIDPALFPDHELVARVAVGVAGAVYLAVQRSARRLVAVKVLPFDASLASPSDVVGRFRREVSVLRLLEHPHILPLLDAGTAGKALYLVSPFVRGGDALQAQRRRGNFPPVEVARLGAALADALAFAHTRSVIHRDVKPANVLLERDGSPRLADFGLAKQVLADASVQTETGAALGTLSYAPPEQILDGKSAGPRADVFALGATLFHLASGRTIRAHLSAEQIARRFSEPVSPTASLCPGLPPELSRALDAALRSRPSERPDARTLRSLLASIG